MHHVVEMYLRDTRRKSNAFFFALRFHPEDIAIEIDVEDQVRFIENLVEAGLQICLAGVKRPRAMLRYLAQLATSSEKL
jgi:hypothetical protein